MISRKFGFGRAARCAAAIAMAAALAALPCGGGRSSAVTAAARPAPRVEGDLLSTVENITLYGHIRVFSPTGSDTAVEVVTPPQKGAVRLDGASFQYTPYPGERGEDSFTVAATDRSGARSNEAVIAVTIDSAAGLPYFCDMNRHPNEYSAIRLAEAGVLSGEGVGGRMFFYPDRQVERGMFVVQLLAARGWDGDLPVCVNTGLGNDAAIPLWMKPYIRRAIDRGIVTEDAFDAASVPTRAEAVVLTDRALDVEDVGMYNLGLGDELYLPDWSVQSYLNLAAYRMLDLYDGYAHPSDALDRGYAASLLWQLHKAGRKQ